MSPVKQGRREGGKSHWKPYDRRADLSKVPSEKDRGTAPKLGPEGGKKK